MKKITFLILLCIVTITTAQKNKEIYPQDLNKKHELKINVFNLVALSSVNASYERLINKDASFGFDVFYNTNNNFDDDLRKYSLTSYYRWFFSEKFATRGFFVEGFGMLNTQEAKEYNSFTDDLGNITSNSTIKERTDFALGIAVGGKFVTKKNFVAEVFIGLGRNLFNIKPDDFFDTNLVSRGGISLGYRF